MRKLIKYIMGIVTDEEGFKKPVYSHKDVSEQYVKVYSDALVKLKNLQGCPRNMIDYFVHEMDVDNKFEFNSYGKERFLKEMARISDGELSYSEVMMKRSIKALKDAGLIFSVKKGVYLINPEYYFKGNNENRRHDMIRELLESKQ
jgi:hypothetical protein